MIVFSVLVNVFDSGRRVFRFETYRRPAMATDQIHNLDENNIIARKELNAGFGQTS